MITLLLECPRCRHRMKYQPQRFPLDASQSKACVFCNRSFKAATAVIGPVQPRSNP